MQYIIMIQKDVDSEDVYVSSLVKGQEAYIFTTPEEAQNKLEELKSLDTSGRNYIVQSYPDEIVQ